MSEREKRWEESISKIKKIPDIDPDIFDAVVACNAMGIHTDNSCSGHLDHGRNAPSIHISAPYPEGMYCGGILQLWSNMLGKKNYK